MSFINLITQLSNKRLKSILHVLAKFRRANIVLQQDSIQLEDKALCPDKALTGHQSYPGQCSKCRYFLTVSRRGKRKPDAHPTGCCALLLEQDCNSDLQLHQIFQGVQKHLESEAREREMLELARLMLDLAKAGKTEREIEELCLLSPGRAAEIMQCLPEYKFWKAQTRKKPRLPPKQRGAQKQMILKLQMLQLLKEGKSWAEISEIVGINAELIAQEVGKMPEYHEWIEEQQQTNRRHT